MTQSIQVHGLRFPGMNNRLQARRLAVYALLTDLNTAFSSPEYQLKLSEATDQIDVRELILDVHMQVIPQHGFFIKRDMEFSKRLKLQVGMQTFINTATHENPGLGGMAFESLQNSGAAKSASLPPRRKGRKKGDTQAPLVLKSFAVVDAGSPPPGSAAFKDCDPGLPLVFGGWFGEKRAPAAFLEAPSEELATYLREDPMGPFVAEGGKDRWQNWGFDLDKKEEIMKADWHTVPDWGQKVELFVPRMAKPQSLTRAPPRCLAFCAAFRTANQRCWNSLVTALQDLQQRHHVDGEVWVKRGSRLIGQLIRTLNDHGQFGAMEAQVWWGERMLRLPSHKDGATSLLHLGITLGGRRTLRVGAFKFDGTFDASQMCGNQTASVWAPEQKAKEKDEEDDVWEDETWTSLKSLGGTRKEFAMEPGSMYLSSPYVFEHGVRFEEGTKDEPLISLQCRFAFGPTLGKEMNSLRDHVMREICNTISTVLRRMANCGGLRMPSLEEVKIAEQNLAPSP